MGGIHHTLVDILVAVKIVSGMKLVQEKGDHTVTFTLTVALAFPSGMRRGKSLQPSIFELSGVVFHSIYLIVYYLYN